MSLIPIVQGGHSAASGFDTTLISNSIWLDGSGTSGDSLTRSWGAPNNQDRWIWSTWYCPLREADSTGNRGVIFASGSGSNGFYLIHTSNDSTFGIFHRDDAGNEGAINTTESYRDLGRWLHLLVDYDSANSTAADRISLYVNGVKTGVNSGTRPGSGNHINVNVSGQTHRIGQDLSSTPNYHASCYLSQTLFLDNKSIAAGDYAITDFFGTPATFGTNGSQIIPLSDVEMTAIANAGGDQSSLLLYTNASDPEADASNKNSGSGNDWSTSTVGTANQSTNTPSLVYPTLNPLAQNSTGVTLSNGNLGVARSSSSHGVVASTMGMTSGKFYCEVTINDSSNFVVGLVEGQLLSTANRYLGQDSNTYGYDAGGQKVTGGSYSSYGTSYTSGDVVSIIFDADAGKLFFGKDGTVQNSGNPVDGTNFAFENLTNGPYFFAASVENVSSANVFNFGTSSFAHTPPTGFVALNSANLTAPTHFGCDYFTPVKYTGNGTAIGSGGKAVTGANLQPDFVWIKNRDASDSHALYDVVRGTTKQAETDTTAIETTEAEGLSTFGSDGFTVGSLAEVNTSSEDFISWNFKAGGSASSNGSGSITSSVSAAAPGHFSIVSWTGNTTAGATVGHGLGGTPEFIIGIARNESGENKPVYHKFMTADTDHLKINENNAQGTAGTTIWDVSAMSSTVIGLGAAAQSNSTNGMIAFCFRSVPGVCKVGSYVGNGNADGPYVVTGFTPSWVMVKPIGASNPWTITDTARDPVNATTRRLHPNLNQAEETDSLTCGDILADGFKVRASHGNVNQSGISFLYVALSQIAGNGTLPPILGR